MMANLSFHMELDSVRYLIYILSLTLIGYIFVLYFFNDYTHRNHIPIPTETTECQNSMSHVNTIKCEEFLAYDGKVRLSILASDRPNCCQLKRENLDENKINFYVQGCLPIGAIADCAGLPDSEQANIFEFDPVFGNKGETIGSRFQYFLGFF